MRHAFRDRLRAVNAPTDMIDQLGGWSHQSIGSEYGNGFPIYLCLEYMHGFGTTKT